MKLYRKSVKKSQGVIWPLSHVSPGLPRPGSCLSHGAHDRLPCVLVFVARCIEDRRQTLHLGSRQPVFELSPFLGQRQISETTVLIIGSRRDQLSFQQVAQRRV